MKRILILLLVFALVLPFSAAAAEEAETEVWEIWGEQMASEPEAADYDFEKGFDPPGFRPALTPYLLEDQSSAKGCVIVCSGGADRRRSNPGEGTPACEYLNAIGYNAFLLDYRVAPYRSGTMTLDVQRAVRFLRHNADSLEIGGIGHLALMGFSAGAMHCYGAGIAFGGSITPDSVYPEYICDEVDAESADVDAVICVYAAGMSHDTKAEPVDISAPVMLLDENDPNYPEKLPAFFFAGASGHYASGFCVEAYQTLNPLTVCELHMYGGIDGPFGLGTAYDGADQMRNQLEAFLNYEFGYQSREKKN